MIVEDQRDMEEFYREIFSTMGFDVVAVARDGRSAIETYFSLNPRPDLVIMDHRLPGISGLQAAQSILEKD
ncbi:MAG: response regulator, partial [Thermoplasmata archaeon]